jgi:hypothetical protein
MNSLCNSAASDDDTDFDRLYRRVLAEFTGGCHSYILFIPNKKIKQQLWRNMIQ